MNLKSFKCISSETIQEPVADRGTEGFYLKWQVDLEFSKELTETIRGRTGWTQLSWSFDQRLAKVRTGRTWSQSDNQPEEACPGWAEIHGVWMLWMRYRWVNRWRESSPTRNQPNKGMTWRRSRGQLQPPCRSKGAKMLFWLICCSERPKEETNLKNNLHFFALQVYKFGPDFKLMGLWQIYTKCHSLTWARTGPNLLQIVPCRAQQSGHSNGQWCGFIYRSTKAKK